jgi:hypothetical protein
MTAKIAQIASAAALFWIFSRRSIIVQGLVDEKGYIKLSNFYDYLVEQVLNQCT